MSQIHSRKRRSSFPYLYEEMCTSDVMEVDQTFFNECEKNEVDPFPYGDSGKINLCLELYVSFLG